MWWLWLLIGVAYVMLTIGYGVFIGFIACCSDSKN